ncbi:MULTISPECIES: LCP family protein [unclassified Streptomyces]|uniref:LCP family protein n=1 Tax=unclassified Streptomyces TaxID=2593676 RepID=UPI00223891FD|nr:LCP family protein [Streptomyces sp. SHP 1-2]MCW5249807.1 LCP family protein [Streptomyces sp. SHP 1-2]
MTSTSDQATPARHRRRRSGPPRRGRARGRRSAPRRTRRRIRAALVVVLSLVVLGTAGAGWLYLRLNGAIDTFDAKGLSRSRPEATSRGENILVIGSDARTGGNSALGGGDQGDVGRSDTAFLLHVYAGRERAVAVSIPRDTLVTVPPCLLPDGSWTDPSRDTMFNAAFSVGGTEKGNPACTVNTVEHLSGLRVDHTVVVDFTGFAALTSAVGGVTVCLPNDVYEGDLNPHRADRGRLLFPEGEQTVSGQRALDYVRIRHGIGDGSDIGRIKRQQAFVAALLKKVRADGLTPGRLLPLAEAATESLSVDPGLGSADKLLSFALSLKNIDLGNTTFVTIPWRYAGSRVAVVEPDASRLWAALRADRPLNAGDAGEGAAPSATPGPGASTPGESVAVDVRNGTTRPGLASEAAAFLSGRGFTVTGVGDAERQDHAATVVRHGPGLRERAEAVAALFPGAELESVPEAVVTLVLGQSYTTPDDPGGATPAPDQDPAPGRDPGRSQDPVAVPSSVTADARPGDASPCSDLSYGSGG